MSLYKCYVYKLVLICVVISSFSAGCSMLSLTSKQNYLVSWSSGFQMSELLSQEISISEQEDLEKLLDAEWYANIMVVGAKRSDKASLVKCSHYFSEFTEQMRAFDEKENNSFLQFSTMCRATALLLKAKGAGKSNIPSILFNKSMPYSLPAEIALQTSEKEAGKNASDTSKRYWSDINKGFQFTTISSEQIKLSHDAGMQDIVLVGRGDFNMDGLEDIMISSRDSVEGGTYFNLRLFILSVNSRGQWFLVDGFKLL